MITGTKRRETPGSAGNAYVLLGGGYPSVVTEKFHGAVCLRFMFSTVFIFNKKVYPEVLYNLPLCLMRQSLCKPEPLMADISI